MKLFTQRAAVSHGASGLQRSHLIGSSSQTKSEEETQKYTVHVSSRCTEHLHSMFGLGGSVVLLLELSCRSAFFFLLLNPGGHSLISPLMSQTRVFWFWGRVMKGGSEVERRGSM